MSEDFYEALGVSRDASEAEINRAYREKASEYHPDVSDDPDAEEKFKRIQKAKEVLTDEEKREAYDRLGHDRFVQAEKQGGFDDNGRGGRGGRAGPGGAGAGPFGGGGGIGDIFDEFFGGGRGRRQQGGRDLKTSLTIDLEEAHEGATKRVTVRRPERCDTCDGRGYPPGADARTCPECNGQGQTTRVQQTPLGRVQQTGTCPRCDGEGELFDETCSTCRGEGKTREESTLSVEIPAGIADGQTLRMDGEGTPGPKGGPNGDLLIDVNVAEPEAFERDGDDLHYRLAVSVPQVTFGDTVSIPTVDGSEEFEVPAGTQSGETFRLRNEGMPRLRGRGHGDLHVHVQVVTPTDLNEEQREALKQFAEAGGEEIEVTEGFWEKIKNTL